MSNSCSIKKAHNTLSQHLDYTFVLTLLSPTEEAVTLCCWWYLWTQPWGLCPSSWHLKAHFPTFLSNRQLTGGEIRMSWKFQNFCCLCFWPIHKKYWQQLQLNLKTSKFQIHEDCIPSQKSTPRPNLKGTGSVDMYACSVASVVSDSLWPSGLEPARLFCPWDSPGKNTAVGCHSLFQRSPKLGIKCASPASPCIAGGFLQKLVLESPAKDDFWCFQENRKMGCSYPYLTSATVTNPTFVDKTGTKAIITQTKRRKTQLFWVRIKLYWLIGLEKQYYTWLLNTAETSCKSSSNFL